MFLAPFIFSVPQKLIDKLLECFFFFFFSLLRTPPASPLRYGPQW